MNERIKELVRQAGLTQAKDFKSGDEVKNFVFGNGLEKFAELIVRECCSAIRLDDVFNGGKFQRTILEHFGVEE
jgi:hypothetical protein